MEKNETGFTFIDLFSGIGGFRLALNNLGGDCLNFSEINKDAINTYCTNFNEETTYNLGDIAKIKNLPKHDLLTAGVPCQSWSIAGRNLGFDDDRGQLWNDTIYLLNKARPKAFIFENVKGLVDPRNKEALSYILKRIKDAGYHANYYVLNAFDYGVSQSRVRVYIIGFSEQSYSENFKLPRPLNNKIRLGDILSQCEKASTITQNENIQKDLFGDSVPSRNMSLSSSNGFNDYFLFNDLRNGHSTIHSWDILDTTQRQKNICYLLLKNRRKSAYGNLDGNPLSLKHFQILDNTITVSELIELKRIGILIEEEYTFEIDDYKNISISNEEDLLLKCSLDNRFNIDTIKSNREIKLKKINITKTIETLKNKGIISCIETRFDFKNTKISTGLYGINRIFLPTSKIFPTLVASDSNDYVSTVNISAVTVDEFRDKFIKEIYKGKKYRKVTKEEACKIQGFPENYLLPETRARWMKLLGNSVSVPVIQILAKAIIETGVFNNQLETLQNTTTNKAYNYL